MLVSFEVNIILPLNLFCTIYILFLRFKYANRFLFKYEFLNRKCEETRIEQNRIEQNRTELNKIEYNRTE